MNAATLVNQTSGEVEYFTPQSIINAARLTMGAIDLDPASCMMANIYVKAHRFFDKAQDGLKQEWFGRVWMNWPFSKGWRACDTECHRDSCIKPNKVTGVARGHIYYDIPSNQDWSDKLMEEIASKRVEQACCITYACTSEKWFQPLLQQAQCYLYPRTNYLLPNGTMLPGVTKGSVVTYFGPNEARFRKEFSKLGTVKL